LKIFDAVLPSISCFQIKWGPNYFDKRQNSSHDSHKEQFIDMSRDCLVHSGRAAADGPCDLMLEIGDDDQDDDPVKYLGHYNSSDTEITL